MMLLGKTLIDIGNFKKFTHGEILDLKAKVARSSRSSTPPKNNSPNYEYAFIQSIENRITPLAKQLDLKQVTGRLFQKSNAFS